MKSQIESQRTTQVFTRSPHTKLKSIPNGSLFLSLAPKTMIVELMPVGVGFFVRLEQTIYFLLKKIFSSSSSHNTINSKRNWKPYKSSDKILFLFEKEKYEKHHSIPYRFTTINSELLLRINKIEICLPKWEDFVAAKNIFSSSSKLPFLTFVMLLLLRCISTRDIIKAPKRQALHIGFYRSVA